MSQRGTSRAREQRLRQGGLFVPLVFAFTAGLEGLPVAEFLDSPTKIVNGLRSVYGYFSGDAVACWCDDTALAATLGCPRDWSTYPPRVAALPPPAAEFPATKAETAPDEPAAVAAEVVRRLGQLLPDAVLVGAMPGPGLLAAQVSGVKSGSVTDPERLREAAKACLAHAKALSDAGLDILLVREHCVAEPDGDLSASGIARLYSPIWNTTRHYGVAALLAPEVHDAARLAALAAVIDGVVVPPVEARGARAGFKRVGIALPSELLELPKPELRAYLHEHDLPGLVGGGVFLVTTDREVPPDIEREALIAGVRAVRDELKETNSRG